jgi:hypothetical protein
LTSKYGKEVHRRVSQDGCHEARNPRVSSKTSPTRCDENGGERKSICERAATTSDIKTSGVEPFEWLLRCTESDTDSDETDYPRSPLLEKADLERVQVYLRQRLNWGEPNPSTGLRSKQYKKYTSV